MKLAIIGGRDFVDYHKAKSVFLDYFHHSVTEIVSGGAKGADAIGKKVSEEFKLEYTEFPAEWDKYGKSAGFRRNIDIIKNSDWVLAFWDSKSKGTQHSIGLAKKYKKNTTIIYY